MSTGTSRAAGQTSVSNPTDYRLSVVLPVYNEVENIPILFEELQAVIASAAMESYRPVEIIWVEDGSDDGTSQLIDELAADHEYCRALHLGRNCGQSAALAAGFDNAHGEFVVPMDADLQNDPHDIPPLLDKLTDGYDCVSGYRKDRNDPPSKTIPSKIQTYLAKATGPDIHDFGCTLTAYRGEALEDINLYGEGHRYIPAKLYDRGYSITELEVNHRERKHGKSRYGIGRLIRGFVDLVYHYFYVHYSTRPLHLFGPLGIGLGAIGGLLSLQLLFMRFGLGEPLMNHLPRLLLAVLLILSGLLVFILGVLSELLTRIIYSEETEYRVARTVE